MTALPPRSPPRLDRVVVALDLSEPSLAAAQWVARHFARGAELVLVHVIHVPAAPRFLEGRYPPTERLVETARAGAELRLRELGSSIATGLIWTEVRVGVPDEEIVRVAEEYKADLIVVGHPAPRAGIWGRLGTTAQRVLRRSTVPVLLAVGMPPEAPARLLVAVDDSPMTGPVLDWAGLLVQRFAAEAAVAHVLSMELFTGSIAAPWPEPDAERRTPIEREPLVRDTARWLAEQVQGAPGSERMTPVVIADFCRPAECLVAEAARRDSQLIVIGSRGAGAARRFLLGSVAEAVLRDSPCPTLVVAAPEDARGG